MPHFVRMNCSLGMWLHHQIPWYLEGIEEEVLLFGGWHVVVTTFRDAQ